VRPRDLTCSAAPVVPRCQCQVLGELWNPCGAAFLPGDDGLVVAEYDMAAPRNNKVCVFDATGEWDCGRVKASEINRVQWRLHAGAGGGAQARPKSWLAPKFCPLYKFTCFLLRVVYVDYLYL